MSEVSVTMLTVAKVDHRLSGKEETIMMGEHRRDWSEISGRANFPWKRGAFDQLPEAYRFLQDSKDPLPVKLQTGKRAWLVGNYETARKLFSDERLSSSRSSEAYPYYFEVPIEFKVDSGFIGWDPPEHTVYRRALAPEFSPKAIEGYRQLIEEVTIDSIKKMKRVPEKSVDLMESLALPVPSYVIGTMLGVSRDDYGEFHSCAKKMFGRGSNPGERKDAISQLMNIIERTVSFYEGSNERQNSLIGRVMDKLISQGKYDHHEMVVLARLLMNAGHETSADMIGLSSLILLTDNKIRSEFLARDSKKTAVDELLRFLSPSDLATSRSTTEDIKFDKVTVPKGEGIIILGAACNRDPNSFDDADRIILERSPNRHLSFGHGIHRCIGAPLAEAELEITLTRLFNEIPTITLDCEVEEIPLKDGATMFGPYELMVRW